MIISQMDYWAIQFGLWFMFITSCTFIVRYYLATYKIKELNKTLIGFTEHRIEQTDCCDKSNYFAKNALSQKEPNEIACNSGYKEFSGSSHSPSISSEKEAHKPNGNDTLT